MMSARIRDFGHALLQSAHRPDRRWFAGLTWNGIGLLVLLCAVNAVRRTIMSTDARFEIAFSDSPTFAAWLLRTAQTTIWGLIIALPVALTVVAAYNLAPPRPAVRYSTIAMALVVACMASIALAISVEAVFLCGGSFQDCVGETPLVAYVGGWVRYGPLSALFTVVFVYLRIAEESLAHAQHAERDRLRLAERMDEALLRVLQAQIEPHFLFNTLASVRRLYDKDTAAGARMLDHLMRYLEVALPRMRESDSTLERDANLAESFLRIHQIRMGERLGFSIDIPAALRTHPVPPMMLLTLVENAIKHGVNPLPDGGRIRISARAESDRLILSVADTGVGFAPGSGAGTGLANIRARLKAQFGERASLALENNDLGGVTAAIALPLQGGAAVSVS
jgi:signal transduction histidine kinase